MTARAQNYLAHIKRKCNCSCRENFDNLHRGDLFIATEAALLHLFFSGAALCVERCTLHTGSAAKNDLRGSRRAAEKQQWGLIRLL
jgi:hypothetical protein